MGSLGNKVMGEDEKYVQILSVFHYIVAGITALFACFPFIHIFVGICVLFEERQAGSPVFGTLFGLFFIAFAACFICAGWALAVCIFLSGRFLAGHVHHTFCLVVAALECMLMPFGTVLGVFTILVLVRPSVKQLFSVGEALPDKT